VQRTPHRTLLILRRNRRIKNRARVLELHSGFQTALEHIQKFERRIRIQSMIVALLLIGLGIGAVCAGFACRIPQEQVLGALCFSVGLTALCLVGKTYRAAQRSQRARRFTCIAVAQMFEERNIRFSREVSPCISV